MLTELGPGPHAHWWRINPFESDQAGAVTFKVGVDPDDGFTRFDPGSIQGRDRTRVFDLADVVSAGDHQAGLLAYLPHDGGHRRLASLNAAARWGQIKLTVVPAGLAASSLLCNEQQSVPLDQGSHPKSHVGHRHIVPTQLNEAGIADPAVIPNDLRSGS